MYGCYIGSKLTQNICIAIGKATAIRQH